MFSLEVSSYKNANQPCFYEGQTWRENGEPRHHVLELLV